MITIGEMKEVYRDLDDLTFRTRSLLAKFSDYPNGSIPCACTESDRALIRHLEFLRSMRP